MLGLLLDTHYAYALAGAPGRFTSAERGFLADPPAPLFVSAVSVWEMRLKWQALYAGGGRKGPIDPARALAMLRAQPVRLLALTAEHAVTQLEQALSHHDPFDDLLMAQAQCERFLLVTRDGRLIGHPLALAAAFRGSSTMRPRTGDESFQPDLQ